MPSRERVLNCGQLRSHLLHSFFNDMENDKRSVGLELEIFPFRESPDRAHGLVPLYGDGGVVESIHHFAARHPQWSYAPNAEGSARFVHQDGAQITFEPGAQIEYSSAPHANLERVIRAMNGFLGDLNHSLSQEGIWLYHSGLNPWYRVDEVGLQMQKDRYINMNNYFAARGPYGQKMMRLSTSLQVNLDVGTADVAPRRWLAANLMAPIMTAAFANSPFCEQKVTGAKSFRSVIWQSLDPTRTGFQRGLEAAEYCPCPVEQYLEFALDAYCMFLPDDSGHMVFDGNFRTFRHWMECGFHGQYPTLDDWLTHLSTLFPEVRPRGFYEIRYLDALSASYWMIPGIVLTHALYDESVREKVIELLLPYRTTLTGMLREAATLGLEEPDLASLANQIFGLALSSTERDGDERLAGLLDHYIRHFTSQRKCPADELLALNDGAVFTPQQYRDYEKRTAEAINSALAQVQS
ncbi:MAG: hypothetical protein KDC35_08245 [Acidobacteria bacterium]|nr:hypothetical protein [Acidobacteriota bacterium]